MRLRGVCGSEKVLGTIKYRFDCPELNKWKRKMAPILILYIKFTI